MILRGRDRGRQMAKPELFQSRQEPFVLLAAEYPEYEFGGVRRAAPGDDGENEAGEKRVVEIGDAAPARPFRFVGVRLVRTYLAPTFGPQTRSLTRFSYAAR